MEITRNGKCKGIIFAGRRKYKEQKMQGNMAAVAATEYSV